MNETAGLRIRVDTADIEKADRQLKGLYTTAASGERSLGALTRGMAGVAAAAAAAMAAGTKLAVQHARQIVEMGQVARSAGVAIESFSRLDYAARLAGVQTTALGGALQRLSERMSRAATGNKDAAAAFRSLDVEVRRADGTLRDADQVLADVAERFRAMPDGAGKTAAAVQLFGESGARLIPMLNQGADGLKRLGTEADALGATLSGRTVAQAERFNEQLQRLSTLSTSVGRGIALEIMPTLSDLIEQFVVGKKAAGGFWAALGRYGLTFGEPDELIKRTTRRIAELQAQIARDREVLNAPPGGATRGQRSAAERRLTRPDRAEEIGRLEADLEYFRLLSRQGIGADVQRDLDALFGASAPKAAEAIGKVKVAMREVDDQASRTRQSVADLIHGSDVVRARELGAALEHLNTLATLGLDKEVWGGAVADVFKGLASAGVDTTELLTRLDKQFFDLGLSADVYDSTMGSLTGATITFGQDGEKALQDQAEKWKDLIDPTRQYQRQLEEIRNLVARGKLTKDQGTAAEFEVESKRGDELMKGVLRDAKKTSDAARELGLTFQSAFEDAVVGGERLSHVLRGIGQDLVRLTIRKSVTEPLSKWAAAQFDFSWLIPSHAKGLDYVPYDNYPALLHKGERVMTAQENSRGFAGVTINQVLNIGSGVSRAEVYSAAVMAKEQAKREILESMRNGGEFS